MSETCFVFSSNWLHFNIFVRIFIYPALYSIIFCVILCSDRSSLHYLKLHCSSSNKSTFTFSMGWFNVKIRSSLFHCTPSLVSQGPIDVLVLQIMFTVFFLPATEDTILWKHGSQVLQADHVRWGKIWLHISLKVSKKICAIESWVWLLEKIWRKNR